MSEQALPEAVERVLQQFEAMAGASDWHLRGGQMLDQDENCTLTFIGGGNPGGAVADWGPDFLGLTEDERSLIIGANDQVDRRFDEPLHPIVRARLLAAAGLA